MIVHYLKIAVRNLLKHKTQTVITKRQGVFKKYQEVF